MIATGGRSYQVLVVEDNPADAYVIREAFKECGYSCELVFAASPQDAHDKLMNQAFELIVCDLGVYRDEARLFVRQVRAQAPCSPVIILSGYADPNPAYEAGANAFIRKVSDVSVFFEKIAGLMRFWVDVAALPNPESCEPGKK